MISNRLDLIEKFAVDVILERRWGFRAGLFRLLLWFLSGFYSIGVRFRSWCYQTGVARVHSLGCRVISVGNLTVGGTGKTPVVELFAKELSKNGRRVAILSRGYKSLRPPFIHKLTDFFRSREHRRPPRVVSDGRSLLLDSEMAGDEPFMLASNLRDVVVIVDKDRVKGGLFAIRKFGCDTLILDDGMQYLPLRERFNVVLIDRESPFANRYLLPRGLLRESPRQLKRADLIFITKCDGQDIASLRKEIKRYNRHAPLIECGHRPLHIEDLHTQEEKPLEFLKDLRIGAITGIARPESFEAGLKRLGAEVIYSRQYADHHRFSESEIKKMFERSRARGAKAILTTEKDAVRFPRLEKRLLPIYFLRMEIEIIRGHDIFSQTIQRLSPAAL